jgi:hypothetical protein
MEDEIKEVPQELPKEDESKKKVKKQDNTKELLDEMTQLKEKLAKYEEEKLLKDQDREKVISTLQKEVNKYKSESMKTKSQFAYKEVTNQIKTEALKQGCINPEKLIKLLPEEDLKTLTVDEQFNIDQDALKNIIEKAKKDHEDIGLFGTKRVNFTASLPDNSPMSKPINMSSTPKEISLTLGSLLAQNYK